MSLFSESARYLGYGSAAPDDVSAGLIRDCLGRLSNEIEPLCCGRIYETKAAVLRPFLDGSKALRKAVGDAPHILLLAATLGAKADLIAAQYAAKDMALAAVWQGCCAAYIETYLNGSEVAALTGGAYAGPRFSPGYGDLDLALQPLLLRLCDAERSIGLCLTKGGLLTPLRSVTALMGLFDTPQPPCGNNCSRCETPCAFRRNCEVDRNAEQ